MPAKGQTQSVEAIDKQKKSHFETFAKSCNWELVEPYLDVVIDNGSRNRRLKFVTLREFKQMFLNGLSLKSIKKMGISKHLIGFYSNLLHGKIKLTEEEFIKEYVGEGVPLEDIATKHNITKDDITFLRQLYGVKAKGRTYQNRKRTEIPLTQRQIEILYGSMMGDAKKESPSSAGFVHGPKQKDYLLWKFKEFENVSSKKSLKVTTNIDKRTDKETVSWRFYTKANSDIEKCIEEFYRKSNNNKKEVSQKILDVLTPLSLSIWFQDDGKTDFAHRAIKKDYNNVTPTAFFCTDSFSIESCELIKNWFKQKFDISVRIKEKTANEIEDTVDNEVDETENLQKYRIIVENEDTQKFFDLIRPYVLPMFQYKIDYKSHLIWRNESPDDIKLSDIIRCPLGDEFAQLPLLQQDEWVNKIVSYWHGVGFDALVNSPKKFEKDMEKAMSFDMNSLLRNDHIRFVSLGNRFLIRHFPHFWSARPKGRKSAREIFSEKKYLSEIVREIILDKKFPKAIHILRKMRGYRGNKAISNFMPCVAAAIYHKYCSDGANVIDFCAGYGGRLFGSAISKKVNSYTGIEVNIKSHLSLFELSKTISTLSGNKTKFTLINQDSIIGMQQFKDNNFDFCFTSVPYFDAEEYDDGNGQSCVRYAQYGEWFNSFLIAAILEARRISKTVAINVANTGSYKIADDLEKWLKDNKIKYKIDQIKMTKFGGGYKYEPIFVF